MSAVAESQQLGLLQGDETHAFHPQQNITLGELATILVKLPTAVQGIHIDSDAAFSVLTDTSS